jgi:hypothetical protein
MLQGSSHSLFLHIYIASLLHSYSINSVLHVFPQLPVINYALLKDVILANLPNLMNFDWLGMSYPDDLSIIHTFGSFAGFKKLKDIGIDYNLCVPVTDVDSIIQELPDFNEITDLFPNCLVELCLTNLSWNDFSLMIDEHPEVLLHVLSQAKILAAKLPPETIFLGFYMDPRLGEWPPDLLQTIGHPLDDQPLLNPSE